MQLVQSLQSRLLIGAIAWGLLALVVTGAFLSYLMREQLEDQLRHRLAADLNQLLAQIGDHPDGLAVPTKDLSDPLYQRVYSGHYWQINQQERIVARSRSLWDQELQLPRISTPATASYRYLRGPREVSLLAYTRVVTLPRMEGSLRLTVAANLQEIDAALVRFRLILALGLLALAAGLVLAALLQVRLGLRPLRRMQRGLAQIRKGESQQLQGDYPREVQPLVDDLNAVLRDNQALIQRARKVAGNLAHSLKTPLTIIANEADDQSRHGNAPLAARLDQEVGNMRRQIDWHLMHARVAASRHAGSRTPVSAVVERLRRTLVRLFPAQRITATQSTAAFRGEAQDLEQMLGNLMENACKWAQGNVRVATTSSHGNLHIRVEDDGPGLSPKASKLALERGRRLDESQPGDGLGLSIVRELAELYDGQLHLGVSKMGGLKATLTLPLAGQ